MMNAYIQTALGILVSLLLFLVGYRQTIGAKKERTKNANLSVHRAILRRMVTEEYTPQYKDITRVIVGKAREFQVPSNDLYSEEQILNGLYTEVFDSELISPSQRILIEEKLNNVFTEIEDEPIKASYSDFRQMTIEKRKRFDYMALMVMTTSMLGAVVSLLFKYLQTNSFQIDWLLSGAGVLIASIALLTTISVFKKGKESGETTSKRTVQIVSSEFENEVLKTLEKMNLKYSVEPSIGNLRPDFLVEKNNHKIAIEAKAWDELVPLFQIRRTNEYLKKLSGMGEINRVFLVTKKKPPVSVVKQLESDKISVVAISELVSALKSSNFV
jgi:hypothetical protein